MDFLVLLLFHVFCTDTLEWSSFFDGSASQFSSSNIGKEILHNVQVSNCEFFNISGTVVIVNGEFNVMSQESLFLNITQQSDGVNEEPVVYDLRNTGGIVISRNCISNCFSVEENPMMFLSVMPYYESEINILRTTFYNAIDEDMSKMGGIIVCSNRFHVEDFNCSRGNMYAFHVTLNEYFVEEPELVINFSSFICTVDSSGGLVSVPYSQYVFSSFINNSIDVVAYPNVPIICLDGDSICEFCVFFGNDVCIMAAPVDGKPLAKLVLYNCSYDMDINLAPAVSAEPGQDDEQPEVTYLHLNGEYCRKRFNTPIEPPLIFIFLPSYLIVTIVASTIIVLGLLLYVVSLYSDPIVSNTESTEAEKKDGEQEEKEASIE